MITFPLFSELESRRDKTNAAFHHSTKPILLERLAQFGFQTISDDAPGLMRLTETATQNVYFLSIRQYEISIHFQHVKTGQQVLICEISNLELNAHTIMDIIIKSIDCWLQYGVVYDYVKAQKMEV